MALIPNDITLQTGFVITVPQFWVSVRATFSNQISGWPNFVRKLDGWRRPVCTRVPMYRSFIRIGVVSTRFLLFSSTQSLWGWVLFFVPALRRTKSLHKIYVALIRGPTAAKYFINGEAFHPHTETMARIHNIRNITPGAIATCSVLVCYYYYLRQNMFF